MLCRISATGKHLNQNLFYKFVEVFKDQHRIEDHFVDITEMVEMGKEQ